MPTYGPYETTREIASGHGSIVFSARKSGEARDNYAVKVFSLDAYLPADGSDPDLDALAAEVSGTFSRSVEIQKRAAAASPHVAPILEVGRDANSAWYVTRLYPRSVQKLLDGRVALSKEWFHHIISSVVRGALAYKKACGRSHGEIQPSNILIGAAQKIQEADVVLADPLPGASAEGARYEAADLNAIGQVIFQLVRRREIEDASDHSILPLMPSPEWTSIFGKDTDAWLSLCNRLLDPNLSLDAFNLEKLDTELARLQPRPPVTGKILALAAVVLVLLGVGAFFFLRGLKEGTLVITSNPPGATIQLNGQPLPEKTPVTLKRPRAAYAVRADFPGLDSQTISVDLNQRKVEQHIEFVHSRVVIETDPPGASILMGGTNLIVGSSPAVTPQVALNFKPGDATLQLDLKGYISTNIPLALRPGTTNRISLTLVKPPPGQVEVTFDSTPRGAQVELDGKLFATTIEKKYLAPGTYKVTGHYKDIWPVKTTNLVVTPNQEAKVDFYFERARVTLESQPAGANVYVSNRLVAVTPTNNLIWPLGLVTFRFEKPGFEVTNVAVRIEQDNERPVVTAPLVSTNGIILLTVDPAPATVLDAATRQEIVQTTPGRAQEITLPPGTRSVIIQATGYQPVATNLVFISKRRVPMSVRLPAELIPVAFSSDPSGADLYDNEGRALGPVETITGVPAGSYVLSARHPRFSTLGWVTNDVTVVKGRPNPHVFKFSYTTLILTSSPPNVKVYELSEGRREFIGTTPTNFQFLRPGPRKYEFIKTDDKVETNVQLFVLEPGVARVGTYFRPPRPYPITNSVGMVMEWIDERGSNGGYWAGRWEVTQAQYQAIAGSNPSTFKGGDPAKLPVETVSVDDAKKFCTELTTREQASLQGTPYAGWVYTLPTRAQWDYYVAAVPLTTAFTSEKTTRASPTNVASLGPNEFGLYDVRGNVWEWCFEGILKGAAYDSRSGFLPHLKLEYAVEKPNPPAPSNAGFRCLLVPPALAQR